MYVVLNLSYVRTYDGWMISKWKYFSIAVVMNHCDRERDILILRAFMFVYVEIINTIVKNVIDSNI